MCSICHGTGYLLVDIGTATIPDYEEVRCACNPEPMADWETMHRFNDNRYEGL